MRSRPLKVLAIVLPLVAVIPLLRFVYFPYFGGATSVGSVWVHDGPQGATLLVVERTGHRDRDERIHRLVAIDARSGERLWRRPFGRFGLKVVGMTPQVVWVHEQPEHEGLMALEPRTGRTLADADLLKRRNPALKVGFFSTSSTYAFDTATGGVLVNCHDGESYLIDPASFAAKPFSPDQVRRRPYVPRPPVPDKASGRRLLQAQAVQGHDFGPPFAMASPPGLLVYHCETTRSGAPCTISRVSDDGQEVWRLAPDLVGGWLVDQRAAYHRGTLFVGMSQGTVWWTARVVAVDVATGRMVWARTL
jgi:hypothetical protein